MQDLGYFKLSRFEKMTQYKAYFISRYLHPTAVFDTQELDNQESMNLLEQLKSSGDRMSLKVKLGRKSSLEVRLICFRLSDEDAEKRIRKIRQKGQRRGKMPSQKTLEMARWSIYVTNEGEDLLSDGQIHLVYSLRWQIELLFKVCKSELKIDQLSSKKEYRILCELYAKLICIVSLMYMCFPVRWVENQEYSLAKAYQLWRLKASDFFKGLKSTLFIS